MEKIDPLVGIEQAQDLITSIKTSIATLEEQIIPEEQRYWTRKILHQLPPNVQTLATESHTAYRETDFPETEDWELDDVRRYIGVLELNKQGIYIPDTYGGILQASEQIVADINKILDRVYSEHNPQRGTLSPPHTGSLVSLSNTLLEIIPGGYNALDLENDLVIILRSGTLTEKRKILTAETLNRIQNLLIPAISKEDLYKEY